MGVKLELLVFVSVLFCTRALPVPVQRQTPRMTGTTAALIYLSTYGYMDPSANSPQSGALISEDAIRQAIMEFQGFAGLNMTGELDKATIEMMNTPRCGVKDKVGYGSRARRRRYALQGSRWRTQDLYYKITKYPTHLSKGQLEKEVALAFKMWSDVTNLTFTPRKSGKIHIEIRFERGEHGDGDPFDGPGGTLAHAYFPIYGGDAHFDDAETWSIDSYRGTNYFQVAAHEFGHSLGLSHSDTTSALMAPFYRGYDPTFKLDKDDITAIQSLYGKKSVNTKPAVDPGTTFTSELCSDATIDAIVTMSDQKTYAFKGSKYWRLTDEGVEVGYPQSISKDWGGLPGDLDAAFTWTNGKTYFFKGSSYWRFTDLEMDSGYPKDITKGFAGIPSSIDAAFVWTGNGKIYFFKGSKYWRFDPTKRPPVSQDYPKPVGNWEGIPDSVDDALQYSNGYTYFFKKGQYWRFNDKIFEVDKASPSFPRPVGYWWFGCPASASQKVDAIVHSDRGDVPFYETEGDTMDDALDADGPSSYNPQKEHKKPSSSHHFSEGSDSGGGSGCVSLTALFLPAIILFLRI